MEEQLIELQMLLMDLQQSIDSLGNQQIEVSGRLDTLDKRVLSLEEKLKLVLESLPESAPAIDEKPPHY